VSKLSHEHSSTAEPTGVATRNNVRHEKVAVPALQYHEIFKKRDIVLTSTAVDEVKAIRQTEIGRISHHAHKGGDAYASRKKHKRGLFLFTQDKLPKWATNFNLVTKLKTLKSSSIGTSHTGGEFKLGLIKW
jgi:hypothetical protein